MSFIATNILLKNSTKTSCTLTLPVYSKAKSHRSFRTEFDRCRNFNFFCRKRKGNNQQKEKARFQRNKRHYKTHVLSKKC